jgi:uncharacterized protein
MELTATYTFHASIDSVWALLMDTDAIGGCLPGSRGLEPLGNDRYQVELGVAIAAIAGSFKGTVAIEDKNPPESYTLVIDGSGRQGFVKGRARVALETQGADTLVRIAAQADAGGLIARVGQRLLEGIGRTMMDRFFACMAQRAG